MFARILYATDGSAYACKALDYTLHLAKQNQAEVIIVHAYAPPPAPDGAPFYLNLLQPRLLSGDHLLHAAKAAFEQAGVIVHHDLLEGPAADAILQTAQAYECDLIVLGVRGLGEQGRLLLGDVSYDVIRFAHCPVLVIP